MVPAKVEAHFQGKLRVVALMLVMAKLMMSTEMARVPWRLMMLTGKAKAP